MLASEKYNTIMCRHYLEIGPNCNHYKNITNLLENSAWAEMHYSQNVFVYNALIILHPLIKGRNVKAVQEIYIYQVLLVTSPVLRLLTPGAFLQ